MTRIDRPAPWKRYFEFVLVAALAVSVTFIVAIIVDSATPQLPTSVPAVQGTSAEVIALREKLDYVLAYQEAFLDVVLWGMGLTGTLAVLLVGYGWFTQRQMYERDLAAMEKRIEAATAKQEADLAVTRGEFSRGVENAREAIRAAITKHNEALDDTRRGIDRDLEKATSLIKEVQTAHSKLADKLEWEVAERLVIDAARHGGRMALFCAGELLLRAPKVGPDGQDYVMDALKLAQEALEDLALKFDRDTLEHFERHFDFTVAPRYLLAIEKLRAAIKARPEMSASE